MEKFRRLIAPVPPLSLQEEFAGAVARAVVEPSRDIESLRGRMSEGGSPFEARRRRADDHRECRSIEGLFEGLLAQSFSDK